MITVMKFGNTPHRFYQFNHPTHDPFDDPVTNWPTIVGRFFAPVVRHRAVKGFVFLNHRPNDIELRLATTRPKEVEQHMTAIAARLGIKPKSAGPSTQTIAGHAYHGDRWISPAKEKSWALAQRRSELMFRFLHAGCALFIDNLARNGDRFEIEANKCQKQNPLENVFESAMHCVANFSQVQFDVLVIPGPTGQAELSTVWMSAPTPIGPTLYQYPGARCRL